jgi:uncharacterized protein (UPF0335 family)
MLQKTNARLIEYADRLSRLEEERKALSEDIKEAYADAKSEGFTVSALKKAIKIHSMDADKRAKHDAAQLDLEMYLAQIEGRAAE